MPGNERGRLNWRPLGSTSASLADSQIFRGHFAPVFLLFVTHLGPLNEGAQAGSLNSGDVHKHVLAAVVGLDKSESLSRIEPLHCSCRHGPISFGAMQYLSR